MVLEAKSRIDASAVQGKYVNVDLGVKSELGQDGVLIVFIRAVTTYSIYSP